MPIYDFQCTSCGYKDEVMRKISAPNIAVCPKCQLETFSKQLSAPSFQLNGTGWYATDFKGGSQAASSPSAETPAEPAKASANASCAPGCACH